MTTTSQLDRIEAKLDRLQGVLDRAEPLVEMLPDLLATLGNTVDDLASRDGEATMDARIRRGKVVLAKLADPTLLDGLARLLEHRDALVRLADFIDALPGYVATVGDSVDDLVDAGRARSIDPEQLLRGMLESRVLETPSVTLLAATAAVLPEAAAAPSERHGLWGLAKVLREPEIQRALSFLIHFTRGLGRALEDQASEQST